MIRAIKQLFRSLLSIFGLRVGQQFSPGVSLSGYSIFKDPYSALSKSLHASQALRHALDRGAKRVLDVGSGGGAHANEFIRSGSDVLCVDFGTSIYAEKAKNRHLSVHNGDFLAFAPSQAYDLVWASHVLEHQRNVGSFIQHLIACCRPGGLIYITVPDPHHQIWGGHLSVWSPGLLAYNVALCGIDLSRSTCLRGTEEFTLIFRNRTATLPALTYDFGDVTNLGPALPPGIREGKTGWHYWSLLDT